MQKWVAVSGTIALFLVFFMGGALAADITISTYNSVYYITSSDTSITIEDHLTVKLVGSSVATYNLSINCGQGVSLTLQDVHVASSSGCALSFAGSSNNLILIGSNSLSSGSSYPGINVEFPAVLTISGDGSVAATGGSFGAGIGSGFMHNIGTITVSSGTITATGGDFGAGIGGGEWGDGGNITISGGRIIAKGGSVASGIGGGLHGDGTNIAISGGVVYAQSSALSAMDDIGAGSGSLTISGTAAVFLKNDTSLAPTLLDSHVHKTTSDVNSPMQVVDGTIYGITRTGISPWNSATGGYFVLYSLVYNANGGYGSVPDSATHFSAQTIVNPSSGMSRSGYVFSSWNTAADGSGTEYAAGDRITLTAPSRTLYAQWRMSSPAMPKTGDSSQPLLWLFTMLGALGGLNILWFTSQRRKHTGRA